MVTSGESKIWPKNKPTDLMIALRTGQDEGHSLLESDYETIRLFIMGFIIKSLSSENMTQNMCQLFAYLPLIFPPDTVGKLSNFKPCSRSSQITHFDG